jgi:hypothetical protein
MDTTISAGTQTDITAAKTGGGSTTKFYETRFISDPLDQTSIAANTWTISIATWCSSSSPFFPCNSSRFVPSCLYVWRPSTGAKIGTVFDSLSSTTTSQIGATTEMVAKVNFTGSAVSSMLTGDVLCFEALTATQVSSSFTWHYAFDGSVLNTSDNVAATNHASYVETPETLTFASAGSPSPTTVTSKVVTNKIITKH